MPNPPAAILLKTGAELRPNPQSPYPPKPAHDEVLIRNVCVASNPKDWKLSKVGIWEGHIEGNDVAGYVEAIGDGVSEFNVGDRVGAFTRMRTHDKFGACVFFIIWLFYGVGLRIMGDLGMSPLARFISLASSSFC